MKKQNNLATISSYVIVALMLVVLAFNQFMVQSIKSDLVTGKFTAAASTAKNDVSTASLEDAVKAVIPRGVPKIYGSELNVSFESPVESLNLLALLDGDLYPEGKLKYAQLGDAQKERYVRIGSSIACEFCCGATTLVFSDGKPACGCQHSAAMRGLTKYLLLNHENEYSDQQILDELVKWKALFFPKQMIAKYMQANGQGSQNLALPDMVGGC